MDILFKFRKLIENLLLGIQKGHRDFRISQKMSNFIVANQNITQPYALAQSYRLSFRNQLIF